MSEAIGILGSVMLAVCGAPLLVDVVRKGTARHVSVGFASLWLLGEVFTLAYMWIEQVPNLPLWANYLFNLGISGALAAYIVRDRLA